MKIRYCLPLVFFIGVVLVLWRGLSLNPSSVPSPLINHKAPALALPDLWQPSTIVTDSIFQGKVTLVNVWATWCSACALEHNNLLTLANDFHVTIIGIDYKDDPKVARAWLKSKGNPFQQVLLDNDGSAGINWGVYGTPETFVIDKNGIIRFKYAGPISAEIWQNQLSPLLSRLEAEQ